MSGLCQPPGVAVARDGQEMRTLRELGLTDLELRTMVAWMRGWDPEAFERALHHVSDYRAANTKRLPRV